MRWTLFAVFTIIIWPVLALAEVTSNEHYVFVTSPEADVILSKGRILSKHSEKLRRTGVMFIYSVSYKNQVYYCEASFGHLQCVISKAMSVPKF